MKKTLTAAPRLLLAAAGSGCGKTAVACALIRAWQQEGLRLSVFKCGPDYIDPLFHRQALGAPCRNLDGFFMKPEEMRRLTAREAAGKDLTLIEGVMGYYDGLGGCTDQASAYGTAAATDTPAVLVLDGRGVSLSLAAQVRGFVTYRRDSRIRGVILNRTSPALGERLRPALEAEGVRLFGTLPDCEEFRLESRHLGLALPEEMDGLRRQLDAMGRLAARYLDLEGLRRLAGEAPPLAVEAEAEEKAGRPVTVAAARDAAFCFYYEENLRLLERLGARIVFFSPMEDEKLPEGTAGLLLGGGYPELYAERLSENRSMRESVKAAAEAGMPVLAECGGFLYLHRALEDREGRQFPMAGVFPEKAFYKGRSGRFGYISLTAENGDACLEGSIRGHEFHYWESENPGRDWRAKKPLGGRGWDCMRSHGYQLCGFPHLYYPSNRRFAKRWLDGCRLFERQGRI